MDAQQFLAAFGHIADAPGGVEHLRRMIYQLAITGSLAEQNDRENAIELLTEIESTRRSLLAENRYKRLRKLEGERVKIPSGVAIPKNWCWTRLLDIGEISPRNTSAAEAPAAFLPMSGVSQMHRGPVAAEVTEWQKIRNGYTHFAPGDVVLAKITPCFENGKAAVITDLPDGLTIGAGTTELHVVRPIHAGVLPAFVYLFLRSPYFTSEGRIKMTGSAGQKRLPTDYFATKAFPLPPVEEQVRIVDKVDQLMSVCDELEEKQVDRRKLRKSLAKSMLADVAAAPPADLARQWDRTSRNFHHLFETPEQVTELRSTILALALKGFLTERDGSDGRASAEIEEIARAAALEKAGSTSKRRSAHYGPIEDDEVPSPLPDGWARARLGELCRVINGRAYAQSELLDKGTPVIRVGNLFTSNRWYYSDLELEDDKYCEAGDLLYAWSASFGPFIWQGPRSIFHYHIWKIELHSRQWLSQDFIYYVLLERTAAIKSAGHGISMAHMTKAKMEQLAVAVPPLAEQLRVVARIRGLLQLCDELDDRLVKARGTAAEMAAAAVASLTGIAIAQEEDEAVKAPETQLIAPVRLAKAPDLKDQAPLAALLARHRGEMSANDLWQRFSGGIDAFYAQLKTEIDKGWIAEPAPAEMREVARDAQSA